MKPLTLTAFLALCKTIACAQSPAELSAMPYMRFDHYPSFVYAINPSTTNTVTIKGASAGLNFSYKKPLAKKLFIKGSVGYYRYSFNKINNRNSLFGNSKARLTNLQPLQGAFIFFSSDKYFYNTLSIGASAGKTFRLSPHISLEAGLNLNNYITFSQNYHLLNDGSDVQIENPSKSAQLRHFAFEAGIQVSALKFAGRYRLGPTFLLPVYNVWKTDNAFVTEKNSGTRSKWFKGFGAGFTFCYPLTAKNK